MGADYEISVKKGHKYLTLVMDLDSGAVVYEGDGKGSEALDDFWLLGKMLKKSRAKIEDIATDMSPAYILAVHENCPEATLVFDHFHVVKLMNKQVSQVRRTVFNETKDALEKKC